MEQTEPGATAKNAPRKTIMGTLVKMMRNARLAHVWMGSAAKMLVRIRADLAQVTLQALGMDFANPL